MSLKVRNSLLLAITVSLGACTSNEPSNSNDDLNVRSEEEAPMPAQDTTPREMVMTRVFNAPIERVWHAWSDADHLMRWWGPTGFTSPMCRMDFRKDGVTLVCMRAPKEFGGQDMYNTWTYQKIEPMRRIEFVMHFTDKDANAIDPASIGIPPGVPKSVPHIITFKPIHGGRTEMAVTECGYTTDSAVEMSRAGLEQCLDKMAASFTNH